MYTNANNVRQEAGFQGNSNISDAFISRQILRAESLVNSYLNKVYTLPLPVYYRQTIAFTGTGSGTDTLTITINGMSYGISVTSGLTASQAADAFRNAAASSSSFVTDGIGNGATVTIYSIASGDSTDVTISSTDPQTIEGITATGGTVTAVPPALVETLTSGIAVAYLLIWEYGPEAQDSDKEGEKLLAQMMEMLKAIANKEAEIFDYAGGVIPGSSTKRISFKVGANATDSEGESIVNKFTVNKTF